MAARLIPDLGPGPQAAAPAPKNSFRRVVLWGNLVELYRHRELLWMWSLREIKIRYKQSLLGATWAVLQPLVLMAAFTAIFSLLARFPSDGVPYPIFSYVALVPWTFLATSITFAVPSLVNNLNLVTKIYFPREILPFASVIAAFVDFIIAFVVLLGLMAAFAVPLRPTAFWAPLIFAVQVELTLGIVLILSAMNVRFRDVRFVVPLGIQLWLYASPIIYPVSSLPEKLRGWYMLNPMAGLIESYRTVLIHGRSPDWAQLAISAVLSTLLLVFGYLHFKRAEATFADII